MSKRNFRSHIEARREAAKVRQVERKKRSEVEQVKVLVSRGHGHCKEAVRLSRLSREDQLKLVGILKGENNE